ncbi:hypothetical protein CS063_00420 [Sporanaerobium hydrogeniformans]|uniref:Uncharacterized protein n=1 Tax=Sporanaerobium hydrogeniformans TaxID=3072179 RepID=A0AC61DFE2_9FIRM|nr:histidine kinase [Sporanaerobium hydrogeniformans]PHV71974.1 hypothetical protein CS063_00420 [Sporanaerobium hydrogeniformans]
MKKKRLKKRILLNIFLVLSFAMIASTAITYLYFENIVKNQKISDERSKMHQVLNQINFMVEDIESAVKSMIVDEVMQEQLGKEYFENEYERIKNMDTISKRLIFYNSLRTYIGCSFLELKNGRRYSSSGSSLEADYLNRKFENEDFKTFKESGKRFSDPYFGLDTGTIQPVICYKSEMWDKYHFGEKQGNLYLEIYLEYFLKQIRIYGQEYENVYLIDDRQKCLYSKGETEQIKVFMAEEGRLKKQEVKRVTGGYLIYEKVESTGWILCTLISNDYLWERCKFVLEFFVLIFLGSLGLMLLSTSRLMENIIRPITRLSEQMEHIDYNKLEMCEMVYTHDEIQTLYECFDKMLKEICKGIEDKMKYEKQKKEMEFDIMLSQINPHYLYNVLNTVVYLAVAEKNQKIVEIVKALIYSLQETLNIGEQHINTIIRKELELTECYLTIQKYRYPHRFEMIIQCEEELKELIVPKTIIQPLIENAILHGILPTEQTGTIELKIEKKDGSLWITVEDNGIGIEEEQLRRFNTDAKNSYIKNGRKHIGVANVRDRICYLYGEPYGMEIRRKELGGTIVLLRLPIHKKD